MARTSDIYITEVAGRRDRRAFIQLPFELHRGQRNWIPPLLRDEKEYFDCTRNPAFGYCDATMALAWRGGRPVGRIMGVINRRYNEATGERTGRFCYFETPDDAAVARALLGHVEDWLRSRGMRRVVGPYGFSDQDPEGFLVEGHEHIATIATYYNDPYILRLLEEQGYGKEIDWVVYKVDITRELPGWFEAVHRRVSSRHEYRLVEFSNKTELHPHIIAVFRLMNECYADIYGYSALDEGEMQYLAKKYLPILDPRFIKMVYFGDTLIGFFIGMPCLSEGIRASHGRLFPVGFLHILRAMKHATQLDLLLGAVKKEFQGRGIDVLMGMAMIQSARAAGITMFDSHHELETNVRMRAENERLGGVVYKRYRLFTKGLEMRDGRW